MRHIFWEKRIPSLVGIVLIIIGTVITSYLANIVSVKLFSNAAPSENPTSIRITNISDTSFTVTYQTDASVIGTLSLLGGANQTILDERDEESGIPKQYHLHSLTAKNLSPKTTYTFSIVSGATTFQNNGTPFQVTTGSTISDQPTSHSPATGSIIDSSGKAPQEALVFTTVDGGQTLSTFAKSSGVYIIPLNTMRTKDLTSYLTIPSSSTIAILATDGTDSSNATVPSSSNTIPLITLGSNYDFTQNTTPLASSSATSGFPNFGLDNTISATPLISTPTKDEGFTDQQPQFSGKAPASTTVVIVIHSNTPIQAQVTTDKNGNWTYRPTEPLAPGTHTITITAPNSDGILQTIEQSFVVYASGSQIDTTGTPTPTPSSPTATPTHSAGSGSSTITPTHAVSPTATLTPTKTPTLTPTPTAASGSLTPITPKPSLPPTGSNDTVIGTFVGVATAVTGIALFVLTRGGLL